MKPLLFALPGNEAMAAGLCRLHGWEAGAWELRAFPDGETHVRFQSDPAGRETILLCTLDRPNDKVLPLYLAASVARELGPRRIGLVLPYLAYMRQDARFHSGEGVTAKHFAELLSRTGDWLVTVDPHLHRIRSLDQIYGIPTAVVAAAPAIAAWIGRHVGRPILIGPDEESGQWVAQVAALAGCPSTTLRKERHGDREASLSVPDLAAPVCIAVHPLFAGDAYAELRAAGVADVAALDGVKGVGPSMSKMILEERAKGEFKDWGDFQGRIKGIKGKKAMKRCEAGLVVNGKPMEAGMAKPAKAEKTAAKKEAKDKPAEQKAAM